MSSTAASIFAAPSFQGPLPDTPFLEMTQDVMFYDTDAGGVVHNIAYLRFIETCRTRLAAQLDLALRDMAVRREFAVVVRTEIDYRKPAVLGDDLRVRGWLARVERARFWCAFEIDRAADGTRLITCRQALALVKMPEGRPLRLPAVWAEQWPALAGPVPRC